MKIISLLLGFFVILTASGFDSSFGMESETFDLPSNSIQTFEIPLDEGDSIEYRLLISGNDENQIGFKITHAKGDEDFGNIDREFRSSLIAEFPGDYNFEFDNSFYNAGDKQIEFEFTITKNIFYVYVEDVPDWGQNVSNSIDSAIQFWQFTNPQLTFIFVDSPRQADFSIQFVKDFGTEHIGYTANGFFVEVGLGDSDCRKNWQPYSEKYVSQIIAHEIGHVMNLDHVDDPENIMYPIGSEKEYGIVEEEFVTTSGYGQFVPMCTVKDLSAFRFTVETDDPRHGITVYTVPSVESFENWSEDDSFLYYTSSECSSSDTLRFSGICDGVTKGSGLLILTDEEQTESLTTITVTMQEISLETDSPQETEMTFATHSKNIVQKSESTENVDVADVICGKGTFEKNGQCVPDPNYKPTGKLQTKPSLGGGCLIATATYGSELAPQVQQLREIRDNSLLQTESGTSFINNFNKFYYSFSPIIADYERENPIFRELVKLAITPMISSLSVLNHVDMDSEVEVLGYGIGLILFNVGMYAIFPAAVFVVVRRLKTIQALSN